MNAFEIVKEKTDIKEVISNLTGKEMQSSDSNILCPLQEHDDTAPSFKVYPETNSFYCFGCKVGGSVIDFVMHYERISTLEAARFLASQYNIKLNGDLEKQTERQRQQEKRLKNYVRKCHKHLKEEHREALRQRGISDELIDKYKIGFDSNWKSKGENRIVIPFYRHDRLIYKVGWDYKGKYERKYDFPSKKELGKKPLVHHYNSNDKIYLTEGIFDYLSLIEAEFSVICCLGTHIKKEYIPRLKRMDNKLKIVFDGDKEGKEAAENLAKELWPEVKAEIITLPEDEDINDLWVEGNGKLDLSQYPAETILSKQLRKLEKTEDKITLFKKEIIPLVKELKGTERDKTEREIQAAFGGKNKMTLSAIREDIEDTTSNNEEKSKSKSQQNLATKIFNHVVDKIELFTDERKIQYAKIEIDGHNEIWPIDSSDFKLWLQEEGTKLNQGNIPYKDAISQCKDRLKGVATFHREEIKLNNRVAEKDGNFWYDMSDQDWQAVKINKEGWQIIDDPPILFRRSEHQKPQIEPEKSGEGNPWKLFDYINIKKEDELKLMVYVISCLVPNIPHAAILPHGSQGSGKSFATECIRTIIDPSRTPKLLKLKEEKDIVQLLDNHYCCYFENVSYLSDWLQDVLSAAVTGSSMEFRKLFTDGESYIRTYKRCIGINGINIAVTQADLLDRSMEFELEMISSNERIEEDKLKKNFREALPRILGGVLDTLSEAMKIYPEVNLKKLPRMADFARWGYAIGEALGGRGDEFIKDYREDEKGRVLEALESNPIGLAVMKLMEKQDKWKGAPGELLQELNELAMMNKSIDNESDKWPGSSSWVTRRLTEVKPLLFKHGINVDTGGHSGKSRIIKITALTAN